MLELPGVTLACVDTLEPALGLQAMRRSMAGIRFGDAVLFTDIRRLPTPPEDIRVVDLKLASVVDYSHFMLKGLAAHVHTPQVLVVQWDGFVIDPARWDPAFAQCDYIGPPWPQFAADRSVGNGGFSLRSRALLQALLSPAFEATHPEDLCICHVHRERLEREHGLRFADPALAARFGFERGEPAGPTFGFHGLFNLHRAMPPHELHAFIAALPDRLARNLDAHDLCAKLIAQGRLDTARLLIDKRKRLGMRDRRTLRLRLRWRLAHWRR